MGKKAIWEKFPKKYRFFNSHLNTNTDPNTNHLWRDRRRGIVPIKGYEAVLSTAQQSPDSIPGGAREGKLSGEESFPGKKTFQERKLFTEENCPRKKTFQGQKFSREENFLEKILERKNVLERKTSRDEFLTSFHI